MPGISQNATLVEVFDTAHGKGLRAARAFRAGTRLCRFEGPVMAFEQIPPEEIRHALLLEDGRWLVDRGLARFINHCCAPNCRIDAENFVVNLREVAKGEELTFAYNIVYEGEDPGPWDERWSFNCACGAKNCRGRVDGYVKPDGTDFRT